MEKNNTAVITTATSRNILMGIVENGITKNELANKANIPATTFDRNLKEPERFTLKQLGSVAQALGISFPDLFKDAA